jgi:release factor glutamine methyltransferase
VDDRFFNRSEREMPLQYILGRVPFCSLVIGVEPPTLIPRPETEEWTQWVITILNLVQDKNFDILDLCSGSGCIALALAKYLPQAQIIGADISNDAIRLAEKNKALNALINTQFIVSDLFSAFEQDKKQFDLIVSNPPYLSLDEWKDLDCSVLEWEDPKALAAGQTGLELYEKIISQAHGYLKPLSETFIKYQIPRLVFEFGVNQASALATMLHNYGFKNIRVYKDIAGKDRWITAQ